MKKNTILKSMLLLVTLLGFMFVNISGVSAQTVANNELASNYVKYLKSFGSQYSEFVKQFESLSPESQAKFVDMLKNGGRIDVKIHKRGANHRYLLKGVRSKKSATKDVMFDADFELFGLKILTLRIQGRITHSGAVVKKINKADTYVVKCYIPLNHMVKDYFDSSIVNGRFNAEAVYSSCFGINISGTEIGAVTRTFRIKYNCDGNGDEWGTGIVE